MYIGIDFGKKKVNYALLPDEGHALAHHHSYPNTWSGFQQGKRLILKTLAEQNIESLQIAGEATSYYWLPLFIQFAQDQDFAPFNLQLFLLNARWVHWFKKSKSPNHKDDTVDPEEIALYLRERNPQTPWKYDPHWLSLRFYTRLRAHLVKSRTREKNYLNLFLFLTYSSYSNGKPFSDYLSPVSKNILHHPDWLDEFSSLSSAELAERLQELAGHCFFDTLKIASGLKAVLSEKYPLDPVMTNTIQDGLDILLDTIQAYDEHIARVESKINEFIKSGSYPEVAWLQSVPGVGPVCACGIAAEIGGIARFSQMEKWDHRRHIQRKRTSSEIVDAVAKYAGLWWPKNASGEFEAEEHHLSRQGNAYLRFYVLEAADRMRQHISSFRAYYTKKCNQATKHKHKRALVLTGSKCLDLFVALLRHGEFYRPKEGDI